MKKEGEGGGQQMNKINEKRTYLGIGSDIDIYLTNDNSKPKNIKSNPSTSPSTLLRHLWCISSCIAPLLLVVNCRGRYYHNNDG